MAFAVQQVNRLSTDAYVDESGKVIVRCYQIVLAPGSNPADFQEDDARQATDPATGATIPADGDIITYNNTIYTMAGGRRFTYDAKYPLRILVQCTFSANASAMIGNLPFAKDVHSESVRYVETAFKDKAGKLYASTLGEMLDPLPDRVTRGRKITLSFLAQNFDVSALENAEDCINSDTVVMNVRTYRGPNYRRTFKPKTLILDEVSWGTQTYPGAVSILSVSVVLIYKSVLDDGKEWGWTYRTANRGVYEAGGGSGEVQLIMRGGQPVTAPQYLDENGSAITDPDAQPYMLSFTNNTAVPFGPLLNALNG